jgi:hypothetical protein
VGLRPYLLGRQEAYAPRRDASVPRRPTPEVTAPHPFHLPALESAAATSHDLPDRKHRQDDVGADSVAGAVP